MSVSFHNNSKQPPPPIVEAATGNALYILTHKRILKFIKVCMDSFTNLPEHVINSPNFKSHERDIGWDKNPCLSQTLKQVSYKVGTYTSSTLTVRTIFEDEPIINALDLFAKYRISALPVVQRNTNRLVDIYSKFDVINLAAERSYNQLDVSIKNALSYRQRQGRPQRELVTCTLDSTIGELCKKVVDAEVHRIIVVNNKTDYNVIGVVSLSDLLRFMVMTKNL